MFEIQIKKKTFFTLPPLVPRLIELSLEVLNAFILVQVEKDPICFYVLLIAQQTPAMIFRDVSFFGIFE